MIMKMILKMICSEDKNEDVISKVKNEDENEDETNEDGDDSIVETGPQVIFSEVSKAINFFFNPTRGENEAELLQKPV